MWRLINICLSLAIMVLMVQGEGDGINGIIRLGRESQKITERSAEAVHVPGRVKRAEFLQDGFPTGARVSLYNGLLCMFNETVWSLAPNMTFTEEWNTSYSEEDWFQTDICFWEINNAFIYLTLPEMQAEMDSRMQAYTMLQLCDLDALTKMLRVYANASCNGTDVVYTFPSAYEYIPVATALMDETCAAQLQILEVLEGGQSGNTRNRREASENVIENARLSSFNNRQKRQAIEEIAPTTAMDSFMVMYKGLHCVGLYPVYGMITGCENATQYVYDYATAYANGDEEAMGELDAVVQETHNNISCTFLNSLTPAFQYALEHNDSSTYDFLSNNPGILSGFKELNDTYCPS